MTRPRTRHLKCVVMTQCVVTTRQKCVMRHENELRQYVMQPTFNHDTFLMKMQ